MAEYRTIRMAFWNDPFIESLSAGEKLLYIYLFTSPHTNNLGILEITRRKIAFETGLSLDAVDSTLNHFRNNGKLVTDGNIIFLTKFIKNQTATSEKIIKGLHTLFAEISSEKIKEALTTRYPKIFGELDTVSVKKQKAGNGTNTLSIPHASGMNTVSIPPVEKEEEGEREQENIKYTCAEQSSDCSTPPPKSTPKTVIVLPLNTGEGHIVTEDNVREWQELYPAVDVAQALRNMKGWLEGSPRNRKTKSGIGRFIHAWLGKEQNRGGNARSSQAQAPVKSWLEREDEANFEAAMAQARAREAARAAAEGGRQ